MKTVKGLLGPILSLGAAAALTVFCSAPKAELDVRLRTEALWWAAAVAAVLYLLFVERRTFSSAGIRPVHRQDVAAMLIGTMGTAGLRILIYLALFPVLLLSISLSHVPNTLQMTLWYRALLVVRIAIAGEFLFRAYAIQRMTELGLNKWIAGLISLAVYALANWSGWAPVESIAAAGSGLALTLLYLWRRNLWVNAVAQGAAVGFGLLLH
jgi:membrane protease YdiL (CAAX protease family)